MSADQLLSFTEAAELLRSHRNNIRNLVDSGRLRAYTLTAGGPRYVSADECLTLVKRPKQGGGYKWVPADNAERGD